MIWLKENDKIMGYVPILKKEYTEKEIREMSEYSCYQGWSKLSSLVMRIQGIGFIYVGGFRDHYQVLAQSLMDVNSKFDFECFLLPNDERMEHYRKQIHEVLENLTLYKIKELSEKEIQKNMLEMEQTLGECLSDRTLEKARFDVWSFINSAEVTVKNLTNLQEMFADKGYVLEHNLFAKDGEMPNKDIYEKRETTTMIEMNIYYH